MKAKFLLPVSAGILLGIIIKLFVLDVMTVQGTSMEPSISNGSFIFINKLSYGLNIPFGSKTFIQWKKPELNDAVIYLYDNKIVVKRCVAEENTSLEYSADSEYNLLINGNSIPLTEIQYHLLKDTPSVPKGMILAVGDNYKTSVDSRNYGFIPVENILGRVIGK